MFHSLQTVGSGCFTLHSIPALKSVPKPANLQTQNPKPLLFSESFHFHFKPPPPPLLRFQFNCNAYGSLSSRNADEENAISSTDYLICALDLPPESAERFTRTVLLKSTSNADSVVALFRDYGFTTAHMVDIFSAFPKLLSSHPLKTLKPKLDFFVENEISGDLLHQVLTTDPHILRISLRRKIIPCFQFLHDFYGSRDDAAAHFSRRRGTWVLRNFSDTTVPNVQTLVNYGVPNENIAKLLASVPSVSRPIEEFSETVREVKEMGFKPSRPTFIRAINGFLAVSKEKREARIELFKSFGWSEEQVRLMFVKQPQYLTCSEEKLKESLEFFITKHRWSIDDITKYFTLLTCSIEKRISPRLRVLEILLSRGLVEKSSFGGACDIAESMFLERYVKKYREGLPHLLEVYKKSRGS